MCTYNVQPIIMLLLLLLSSLNSYEIIEKELTVQVTSKRSCVCCSPLSGTNWAYVDHVQTQALPPPPSTPYLSPVPDQGHQRSRSGGGRSRFGSSPAFWAPTEFSHGSDPSNMSAAMSSDGSSFSRENTPCRSPRAKDVPASGQQQSVGVGGGGGGLPRRGDEAWWGGGRAGKRMCYIWNTSSLRKNSQGRCTWILPTLLLGWLQLLIHPWSVALSRIDSRWKKSAYLRGTIDQYVSAQQWHLLWMKVMVMAVVFLY